MDKLKTHIKYQENEHLYVYTSEETHSKICKEQIIGHRDHTSKAVVTK